MKSDSLPVQNAQQIQGVRLDDFFEATPMALWLEDYSQLYRIFEQWRAQGVKNLAAWFAEDSDRVRHCAAAIRIQHVNRQTLNLYGADSVATLVSRLGEVMRDDTFEGLTAEMLQLWSSGVSFRSTTVNYTLDGRRIDIVLRGVVLADRAQPWDQVLVAVEDVTELQESRRSALTNETLARELFQQAPVSLWVEDFSRIKSLLDEVREQGVVDFRTFLDVHPEFVERCMSEIRVLDINGYTLQMYKAKSTADLLDRLDEIFDDEMTASFAEQLIDLWEGRLFQQREVRNRTLVGDVLHIHMQFSVFAGHEADWSKVLLALTDITARKKAEAYLEYLGKHDVLTQLKNRSFYVDELARLGRKRVNPVSFIALDLDNLKALNDLQGHAAGDALLRRMGEVLNKVVDRPASAARIGGDEFIVLLPGMSESDAATVLTDIRRLIELNNQFYCGAPLSVSVGVATAHGRDDFDRALRAADLAMYENKRERRAFGKVDGAAELSSGI
ncbi:MAG TPA: GGDEF domain-containing protein [Pusillimonas sp.]|uniref:sensor domain-containing diguanylate cyclase n=1 Tax=Pusillimonas sp. TaxID=3040095 RepID=UPI002B9A0838|nr:GGDEF domain-containing protein [Pusillimonas sp.]HUH88624.1 GGDEF domain-containing protein [Pusillimonas sp.]